MVSLPAGRSEAALARELARRARALPIPGDEAQLLTYGLLAARWLGCRLDDLPAPAPLLGRAFAHGRRHAGAIEEVLGEADLGATFAGGDPILAFYETFLAAWDPEARSARGVYYTPAAVVTHIVDSVAEMVEASWGGGLAEVARILDPAAGTGAFLLEVVRRAREEVPPRRWRAYVRDRLSGALAGWELMAVPHAICRLRLALALRDCGADVAAAIDVRLGNALDEDGRGPAAEVVIGNPPYAAYSANLEERHRAWIARYRTVDGRRVGGRNALQVERNLNDDYVKFLALAERHATRGGRGAVGVITNHSWIDGESYAGVRASWLRSFERVVCLDLHGNRDRRETGPGGGVDENVFGVSTGVAVVCAIRGSGSGSGFVWFGDLFGTRREKLARLGGATVGGLTTRAPVGGPGYVFRGDDPVGAELDGWPSLGEMCPRYSAATETGFDELLLGWSREELLERVRRFAGDPRDPLRRRARGARIGSQARRLADEPERLDAGAAERYVRPIQFRPFDWRWAYLRREALKTHAFANMERLSTAAPGLATTRRSSDGFGAMAVGGFFAHKLIQRYDRALVFPSVDLPRRRYLEIVALLHAPSYGARYGRRLRGSLPRIPIVRDARLAAGLAELGEAIVSVELGAPAAPAAPAAAREAGAAGVRIGSYAVLECWRRARAGLGVDASEEERVVAEVAALGALVSRVDNLIAEQGGWPRAFA